MASIGALFGAHARRVSVVTILTCATLISVAADLGNLVALATQRFGTQGGHAMAEWQQLVEYAMGLETPEKLALVNDFFNRRVQFTDDLSLWQQPDYWATPLETLGRGAGDCEDFSIAKYTTLKLLGVASDQMRLIYVKARTGGPTSTLFQAHMVLGYYPSPTAEPLVLDNLIGEIRPASRRSDLAPVFSFNGEGLWVGGAGQSSADPTERLSRWRDLLARMREDGFD
ncbi:MAG: transglutaminase-like cysteine peptidase [Rhodocyclaceae bacterium]|nr:transglutaminase-like cysteine peptidase [Rhodocyclaceae bacterium]